MNKLVYKFIPVNNWRHFLHKNGLQHALEESKDPYKQLKWLRTFCEHRDLQFKIYDTHFSYFLQVNDIYQKKFTNQNVYLFCVDPNNCTVTQRIKNDIVYPHMYIESIPINSQEFQNGIPSIKYIRVV
jgi:hypothetical protein